MKKKKKNSIKVSKDSNQTERARPINDPPTCTLPTGSDCGTLCFAAKFKEGKQVESLCRAQQSFLSNYCNTFSDCYYNRIEMLGSLVKMVENSGDAEKAKNVNILINIFKDFITLYSNCSAKVTFLDPEFCTTIHYGKCPKTPLALPTPAKYSLNWLLQNNPKKSTPPMPKFDNWENLYEPNMQAMLFLNTTTIGKPGALLTAALKTLGTTGSPAANPFLDTDQQTDLSTGMSGVDPKSGAKKTKPTFNFDTNFNKIATNIQNIISPGINCNATSEPISASWDCTPFSKNGVADISMTIDSTYNTFITYPQKLNLKSKNIKKILLLNPDNFMYTRYIDLSNNQIENSQDNIVNLNTLLKSQKLKCLDISNNQIKCADLTNPNSICVDS